MLRGLPVGAEGRSQGRDAEAGARQAVLVSEVLRLKRRAWPRGGAQQVVRKHPERQIMTLNSLCGVSAVQSGISSQTSQRHWIDAVNQSSSS